MYDSHMIFSNRVIGIHGLYRVHKYISVDLCILVYFSIYIHSVYFEMYVFLHISYYTRYLYMMVKSYIYI